MAGFAAIAQVHAHSIANLDAIIVTVHLNQFKYLHIKIIALYLQCIAYLAKPTTMKRLLLILLLIIPLTTIGQEKFSIKNKRAIERYKTALALYDRYDLAGAETYLLECVQREPKFVEAYLVLAQIYDDNNQPLKAIEYAEKASTLNTELYANLYFTIGRLYYQTGQYQKAFDNFNQYVTNFTNENPRLANIARQCIDGCKYAIEAIAHPVPFDPKNVGNGINTIYDEYWPSLSADEQTLVYTTRCPKEMGVGMSQSRWQEDFFISRKENDAWQQGIQLGAPINTDYNEGAQSLTSDGRKMYFTVCRGLCNIFVSQIDNTGSWTKPIKLSNAINSATYNEKQPSISPDGQTLYFVSNRPGGKGGYDIWYSARLENGAWAAAKNLGDTINTPYDEQSPFIHFDNQTLYFSSDGHLGMGKQDIFMSQRDSLGQWSKPKNLGYPINSHKNEEGLIVNARGTTAYYSSDVDTEHGRDIYTFDLHQSIRPIATSYFTGVIKDKNTRTPLDATVSLVDLEQKKELMRSNTGSSGKFLVCLPTNRKYGLFVSTNGYLFHSEHFDFNGEYPIQKPYRVEVLLNPIKKDEVIIMRNIFFTTDSYVLRPESTVELDKLVATLQQNPSISIEIGGHTDNQGTADYNQKLSEQRAQSVALYITQHGINASRVSWKGYGESRPINSNNTAEGRAQNRRTEVKVL